MDLVFALLSPFTFLFIYVFLEWMFCFSFDKFYLFLKVEKKLAFLFYFILLI